MINSPITLKVTFPDGKPDVVMVYAQGATHAVYKMATAMRYYQGKNRACVISLHMNGALIIQKTVNQNQDEKPDALPG